MSTTTVAYMFMLVPIKGESSCFQPVAT